MYNCLVNAVEAVAFISFGRSKLCTPLAYPLVGLPATLHGCAASSGLWL
jgi:hypothetical protein